MLEHSTNPAKTNAEIAVGRVVVGETRWGQRGQTKTRERAADLLADLVFVMLLLLLFVWVGLWTFVR